MSVRYSQHFLTLQCKYLYNGFCKIIEQSSLALKAHFVNNKIAHSLLSEIPLLLLILSEQCATLDNQRSATCKVYLRFLSTRYFIQWNPFKTIIYIQYMQHLLPKRNAGIQGILNHSKFTKTNLIYLQE